MSTTPTGNSDRANNPTTSWKTRDINRLKRMGLAIGLVGGIPLGWVSLPFLLWAFGAGMEFYW